eukprot:11126418-Karenia_brevis.AAC.1
MGKRMLELYALPCILHNVNKTHSNISSAARFLKYSERISVVVMAPKERKCDLAQGARAQNVETTARKRRPNKAKAAKVYRLLADASTVSPQEAQNLVGMLLQIAIRELRETKLFTLPSLVSFKALEKKATPAKIKKMFGKELQIEAKPKRTIVKATIMQQLQDAVIAE